MGEPHHVLCHRCVCCGDVTASCRRSASKRHQLQRHTQSDIRSWDKILAGLYFSPQTVLRMRTNVCMDEGYFQKTGLVEPIVSQDKRHQPSSLVSPNPISNCCILFLFILSKCHISALWYIIKHSAQSLNYISWLSTVLKSVSEKSRLCKW